MKDECLALRIRQLNRRVTRIYDAALRPHGVRSTQFNLLIALGLFDVIRASDLARALDLEKSTLSRNLKRLIERRWVTVGPGASGASQELRLTAAGRRIVERAVPAWRDAQRRAAAEINANLVEALRGETTAD